MAVACTISGYRAWVENYLRQLEDATDDEWMIVVGGLEGNVDIRAPSETSGSKRIGTLGFPKELFAQQSGTTPLQDVMLGSVDRGRLLGSLAVKREEVSEAVLDERVTDQMQQLDSMVEGAEEECDIIADALSDATGVPKEQLIGVAEHAIVSARQREDAMVAATDGGSR